MEDDPKPIPPEKSSFQRLWSELKRRHVVRVAITYAVVAWLIIQVASTTFGSFGIPEWAFRFVVIMLCVFFPVAIIVAWAFELTPEGIKTSKKAQEEHPEAHKDVSHAKKRHWFSLGLAAAVPTLIFGVLALFFFIRSGSLESELASTEQVELENDKSIAVLPLENMSPDPENAFFASGVHEDIINNLSKIREFLVIGRISTLQFRGASNTLREIGDILDVRYLVTGSVRRAGDQVRVTAQLIDSQTEGQLWSEDYNKPLDDIFAIQASIAEEIAANLRATLNPNEIAQIEYRPTESQEAYDYYSMSRQQGVTRLERIDLLEKAVLEDPNFSEAWARIAYNKLSRWFFRFGRNDPELLDEAHKALEKSKITGEHLPYYYWAAGEFEFHETLNLDAAIGFQRRALSIDPSFQPSQSLLAQYYFVAGSLEDALRYDGIAIKTNPLSFDAHRMLDWHYPVAGKWDELRQVAERWLERGERTEFWELRPPISNFLQHGDEERFRSEMENVTKFPTTTPFPLWKYLMQRDYSQAISFLDTIGIEDRGIWENRFQLIPMRIWYYLGFPEKLLRPLILNELGEEARMRHENAKAVSYLESIVGAAPDVTPDIWANLAIAYALNGDVAGVEKTTKRVRELTTKKIWDFAFRAQGEARVAIAYLLLGETDKALDALEDAKSIEGNFFLKRELQLWFIFDSLRGNQRFDALLEG